MIDEINNHIDLIEKRKKNY